MDHGQRKPAPENNRTVLAGRYELRQTLGSGGMATVFRGVDRVLHRDVAVKVLSASYARDSSFVDRFRREATAAARLNHPGIVSVYDAGVDGDVHFIVMELVEGRTLADILENDPRPQPERAAEIGVAVAEALSAAHAIGIVHRDVKPANIMITREGRVRVTDFGIARVASAKTLKQTASVLGTATHISPEQVQGLPVDGRSDLYSLGVVLYEMLAGDPPFHASEPVAVAYKHVQEAPAPPSTIEPSIPLEFDAVTLKALAKNPDERYQTADEMAEDLRAASAGGVPIAAASFREAGASAPTEAIHSRRRTRARRVVVRAALAAILGALLSTAVVLGSMSRSASGSLPPRPGPSASTHSRTAAPATGVRGTDAAGPKRNRKDAHGAAKRTPKSPQAPVTAGGTAPSPASPSPAPSPSPSLSPSPSPSPSASSSTSPSPAA